MKIIVTGANGFLAQHLCISLAGKGFEVHGLARGERRIADHVPILYHPVELTAVRNVQDIVAAIQPDVVIHTAAMSKPDECQQQPELCLLHNVAATENLLLAAKQSRAFFIYTSTDFIFGEDGPHAEDDTPHPLNFYGESKWQAEQLVRNSGLAYAIVRPVFIYGTCGNGMRPSFLHWVRNNLYQHKKIKVVTDQFRTPTYTGDLCQGFGTLVTKRKQGVYHLAGKDILSPYQMARAVAKSLQLDDTLIEPVTADTFPEPVQRAKRSGLKIDKAIAELQYAPVDFEEGVRLTFAGDRTDNVTGVL